MESELDLDEDIRKFLDITLNMELLKVLMNSSVIYRNSNSYFRRLINLFCLSIMRILIFQLMFYYYFPIFLHWIYQRNNINC